MTEAIFDLLHEPRDTRKRYTFRYSMTISGVVEVFAEKERRRAHCRSTFTASTTALSAGRSSL